jgi:polyferredoxin
MTRTFDRTVEHDANMWPLLAAGILGIQGLSTLIYATFMPAPVSGAGIDIPVLGTMPFIWIAAGTVGLVAGAGVAARRTWSRYLGSVAAVFTILAGLYNAQNATMSVVAFILPGVVLFALWRKWPTVQSL